VRVRGEANSKAPAGTSLRGLVLFLLVRAVIFFRQSKTSRRRRPKISCFNIGLKVVSLVYIASNSRGFWHKKAVDFG
jgi:hypothetical protein